MDREISKDLFEVENPVYQDFDDMLKKYLGYAVVITDRNLGKYGKTLGGTVRYYTDTSKEIYGKWTECSNIYDDCIYMSFIPRPGSLGGIML